MKPTIIISVRGCHMDDLPAVLVQKSLKFFKDTYPTLPVTLCFEGDPRHNLVDMKVSAKEKISLGRSRYLGKGYTDEEAEYDRSIYWLLAAANLFKVPFVLTDLKDIDKIPLGSPVAESKRAERESCMAKAILKVATETGGIIFDFGGSNHIPGIQSHLKQELEIVAGTLVKAHFFCVYSKAGQQYFPANFRLMQFTGIPEDQYPLGLAFKTTALENIAQNSAGSNLDQLDAEQLRRERLFSEFQQTTLIPAATSLLQLLPATDPTLLVPSVNPPLLHQAAAGLTSSTSTSTSTTNTVATSAPALIRKDATEKLSK